MPQIKSYQWRTPWLYPDVAPQDAAAELEQSKGADGTFNAADVVARAALPDALFHKCFEWDDTLAAQRHREQQARNLICNLVVCVTCGAEEKPVRQFAYVSTEARKGYTPTLAALGNPDERADILRRAKRELESFQVKYGHLSELAEVLRAIEQALIA